MYDKEDLRQEKLLAKLEGRAFDLKEFTKRYGEREHLVYTVEYDESEKSIGQLRRASERAGAFGSLGGIKGASKHTLARISQAGHAGKATVVDGRRRAVIAATKAVSWRTVEELRQILLKAGMNLHYNTLRSYLRTAGLIPKPGPKRKA